MESYTYSSSQKNEIESSCWFKTIYKAGKMRNGEYLRVLSWDLKVCIEIIKYIFTVVRSKTLNMQS